MYFRPIGFDLIVPSELIEVVLMSFLSVCLGLGLITGGGCTMYFLFTRLEQRDIDMLGGLMTLVSRGRWGMVSFVAFSSVLVLCSPVLVVA